MGDNNPPTVQEEKKPLKEDEAGDTLYPNLPEEDLDSSKVKFINGGAANDAVVDIDGQTKVPSKKKDEFVGLSKEELLKYADDPYWVKIRWAFLIIFWLAWAAMLIAAIVIIVVAPKCPYRPNLDWWQKSVAYQVYPRSFKDSNGDGIGDLKGIEQNLDYIRHTLNATAVWLNPIYPSPNNDFGYDVSDYMDVHPDFGTLEEFEHMRVAMHKKGMKLIMDFVPNHVSDQHEWFQKSKASKADDNEFRDYFVWHDGKPAAGGGQNDPPNNWQSVFGGSAWTWVEERKQYYLHQFLPEQPDLNLRNEAVKASLKDVLTFWMLKGVDGFRVDAAAHLVESANLDQDEPGKAGGDGYDSLIHNLTTFQPESYELVAEWRALLDEFQEADTKIRSSFLKSTLVLIVEAYGTHNQTMSFYEYQGKKAAHMPFNMNLVNLKQGMKPTEIRNLIQDWMVNMPEEQWANWVVGNHDKSRIATRMGADWVNANSMLQLTLPGTAFVYYGDEIGMHDVDISWEDTQDPAGKRKGEAEYKKYSRDPERTPMQWSGEINAGFSTSTNGTWLPVATDYQERNVKAQLAHGAGVSNLEVFAQLSTLRQQPSFQWGVMEYAVVDDNVLSYVRQAEGFEGYLVAINYGSTASTVNFHSASPKFVPPRGDVVAHTANFDMAARAADYNDGVNADLSAVFLKPTEGVVFRWTWGATDVKEE